ncbi:insulinase family protein [Candidatus Uhrbacteria bacterium]|nr:insulinase family protein [Candidatus Uhrbacteria bacterium]
MKNPPIHHLSNGMPVVMVPLTGAESMTLLVLCKVGSRYETRELNGASHFIEHLMFKGTKRRPTSTDISRLLDRYGAAYNAYTDKDVTGYYIKMDAAHTELAVDLLYDMLFYSHFDKKEIDKERGVIIEEINMYEDNPQMHIDDLLEASLYPDSTLGWDIAGPRENIRKITREQLVGYRDAYYIPERMTVVLAGKIIPDALKLITDRFGKIKRPIGKDTQFTPFVAPKRLPDPLAFQDKATEQVQFSMAFHGFAANDPLLPAAGLLGSILGGGMSSRLFTKIREHHGLCYSIGASHAAREDIGIFGIQAGLEKRNVEKAVKAIIHELKSILTKGVTAEELRRAKDQVRGRLTLSFEDSASQAEWYGRQWLFKKKLETPDVRLAHFEKVTRTDIVKAAKRLFRPECMAVAVIGPLGTKQYVQKLMKW